jgi:hypothetical protein
MIINRSHTYGKKKHRSTYVMIALFLLCVLSAILGYIKYYLAIFGAAICLWWIVQFIKLPILWVHSVTNYDKNNPNIKS